MLISIPSPSPAPVTTKGSGPSRSSSILLGVNVKSKSYHNNSPSEVFTLPLKGSSNISPVSPRGLVYSLPNSALNMLSKKRDCIKIS